MVREKRLLWHKAVVFKVSFENNMECKGIVQRGSESYEKKQKTATDKLGNDVDYDI